MKDWVTKFINRTPMKKRSKALRGFNSWDILRYSNIWSNIFEGFFMEKNGIIAYVVEKFGFRKMRSWLDDGEWRDKVE